MSYKLRCFYSLTGKKPVEPKPHEKLPNGFLEPIVNPNIQPHGQRNNLIQKCDAL